MVFPVTPSGEADEVGIAGRSTIMGFRERLRRDDGPAVRRYQTREQLMTIGDDYWIESPRLFRRLDLLTTRPR